MKEVADALAAQRAEIERLSAELAAAKRALEAVRVEHYEDGGQCVTCRDENDNPADWPCLTSVALDGSPAALSAASPTTSDEPTKTAAQLIREIAERDPEAHAAALARGYGIDRDPAHYPSAASDEPARCPHGNAAGHRYSRDGVYVTSWCPGPAASGTPDDCWPTFDR